MFLEIRGIKKSFGSGDSKVDVLRGLDLDIAKNKLFAGKSAGAKRFSKMYRRRVEMP